MSVGIKILYILLYLFDHVCLFVYKFTLSVFLGNARASSLPCVSSALCTVRRPFLDALPLSVMGS